MKKFSLVFLMLVILTGFITAEYYIKQNTHTDAYNMMGRDYPTKDIISETWLGDEKFAMVSENTTTILDTVNKVVFVINHQDKTYVEMPLPFKIENYLGEQAKQARMMMQSMTATVTPSGETRQIEKWDCKGYNVKMSMGGMMEMDMKIWATLDVPFKLDTIKKLRNISMELSGTMGGEDLIREFDKIDGFQVASEIEVKVMGQSIKTTTKVIEINEKPAPAGVYQVPEGYQKSDTLPMRQGM